MDKLEAALEMARRNFRVFPLETNGKKPVFDDWPAIATTDENTIRNWFIDPVVGIHRDYNFGVDTSNFAVVDIDVKGGKPGVASFIGLGGALYEGLVIRTPSGGYHAYYSVPRAVANSAGGVAEGVDIRGWHGFVVGPGSTIDGVPYEIVVDEPMGALPERILERTRPPGVRREGTAHTDADLDTPAAIEAVAAFLRTTAPAISGQGGNTRTYQVAARVRDLGVSEAVALQLMEEVYNPRCEPPWSIDELRVIVGNVDDYAQNTPGSKSAAVAFAGVSVPPPEYTRPLIAPSPEPASAAWSASVYDPWDALQPSPFPIDALPADLRAFTVDRAEVMGADPAAIAWSAISACSAAIDGSVRLRMKRHDHWSVAPAIWVALIGPSSSKKTPIINAAWDALKFWQNAALTDYKARYAAWQSVPKEDRKDHPEPKQPVRFVTDDTTVEALQTILSRQDRGIGVFRDELAGFIGQFEKYAGKGGGAADRAFWLQAYNGGDHVVDRVARGTTHVSNLLATIIGGIQPARLATLPDLSDDGLFQRFIPIIVGPATPGMDVARSGAVHAYHALLGRLLAFPGKTTLHLSEGAHRVREALASALDEMERSEPLGPRFSSFVGKMQGAFGRLALVLSVMVDGPGGHVSSEVAEMARVLIQQHALPSAARVYVTMGGGAGTDPEAAQSIAGFILAKGKARILASELARDVRCCRGKPVQAIQTMVSPLVAGGWLNPEREHAGNSAWQVNGRVHQIFGSRAVQEAARRAEFRKLIIGDNFAPEDAD